MGVVKSFQKAITSIPGWSEYLTSDRTAVNSAADAYGKVPMIRRGVDLVADSLSSVPFVLYEGEQKISYDNIFLTSARELFTRASKMLDIYGFVVIEKVYNRSGRRLVDLRVVNGANMMFQQIGITADGQPMMRFTQTHNGKTYNLTSDDVIYIREFNPIDDVLPGISRVQVCIESARLMHYQTQHAASYFEGGAMQRVAVKVPRGMSEDDQKKLKSRLSRLYSGLRNGVGRYLVLSDNIQIETISAPMKDLTVPELASYARREIAQALGVPQTMLEDTSNRASREQDTQTFWQTTIKSRGTRFADEMNLQLFDSVGYKLVPEFETMDVFQEDEVRRSSSLVQIVTAGVPLPVALEMLGYDLPDMSKMLPPATEPVPTTIQGEFSKSHRNMLDELDQWRRFALKRFGKSHRRFETDVIDESLAYSIRTALKTAKTVDEINNVFDDAENYASFERDFV